MTHLHPRGVNHLAISTRDMKGQLEFWCDVMGCPLRALYWLHGVPNALHGFVELSPESYVAFVQHPENAKDIRMGITHAGNAAAPVTVGAMQHVAFHVGTFEELLAMRDRIRSRGIQVMGPLDHGFIQSMYFGGPEGLALEICTGSHIDARAWIDPEVQGLCGISAEEVAAMKSPAPYERPLEPVPQPAADPTKPRLVFPTQEIYDTVMSTPDPVIWERASETTPPVRVE
jgi:catechol 2,3-dioxygenase-like lactoylglutathione lyase family enzyme